MNQYSVSRKFTEGDQFRQLVWSIENILKAKMYIKQNSSPEQKCFWQIRRSGIIFSEYYWDGKEFFKRKINKR